MPNVPHQDTGPVQISRPSAAMIARELGVSAATVSYALNGKPGVSDMMRRRVLKLANESGVRPKTSGKRSPALTRVIALLVPNLTNPMFTHWSNEILEEAATEGFEVLVVATDDDPARFEAAARTLVNRNIDGAVVLAAHREDATALRILREERIPFTFLSRRSEYVSADFVGIDDYAAARELASHVIGHCPERPATVVGPRSAPRPPSGRRVWSTSSHGQDFRCEAKGRSPRTYRVRAGADRQNTCWDSTSAPTRSCAAATRSAWASWKSSRRPG